MRGLLGSTCVWLLVLLMTGTSPFGMGVGVHRYQLLDPVFPHTHVRDAGVVPVGATANTREATEQRVTAGQGPAFGAGTGGLFAGIGADAPALPVDARAIEPVQATSRWARPLESRIPPRGLTFAPPDPPPTLVA
jgi:hypothetical protein